MPLWVDGTAVPSMADWVSHMVTHLCIQYALNKTGPRINEASPLAMYATDHLARHAIATTYRSGLLYRWVCLCSPATRLLSSPPLCITLYLRCAAAAPLGGLARNLGADSLLPSGKETPVHKRAILWFFSRPSVLPILSSCLTLITGCDLAGAALAEELLDPIHHLTLILRLRRLLLATLMQLVAKEGVSPPMVHPLPTITSPHSPPLLLMLPSATPHRELNSTLFAPRSARFSQLILSFRFKKRRPAPFSPPKFSLHPNPLRLMTGLPMTLLCRYTGMQVKPRNWHLTHLSPQTKMTVVGLNSGAGLLKNHFRLQTTNDFSHHFWFLETMSRFSRKFYEFLANFLQLDMKILVKSYEFLVNFCQITVKLLSCSVGFPCKGGILFYYELVFPIWGSSKTCDISVKPSS